MNVTIANAIGRLGDSLDMLLFSWLIYSITNEASWSAILVAFNMLPSIILQPIAGVLIENKEKKKIMYFSDFSRSIGILILLIFFFFKKLNPYIMVVITVFVSSVEAFRVPAGVAIVPKVLTEETINYGMSFSEGVSQCFELIGIGLGGVSISVLGITNTILIDFCIFFVSSIILFRTKIPLDKERQSYQSFYEFFLNFKDAIYYFLKNKIIWFLCLLGLLLNMVMTPISSLQTPYIVECLHMGPAMLSFIGIISSLSMILGVFSYPVIAKLLSNRLVVFIGGIMCSMNYLLWGGANFFQSDVISILFVILGTFIGMLGLSMISNSVKIIFVKEIDESFLARMSGMFNSLISIGSPLLAFCTSVILMKFSVITVLFLCFIVFFLIFLSIYILQKSQKFKAERR